MNELSDSTLLAFKAITTFVKELGNEFGKKQKSLALYHRLIDKTTLNNVDPILKHVNAFKHFCITNKESLYSKDPSKLIDPKISYSDRVYISMNLIFNLADNDTKNVIWQHLLTISAFFDDKSKKILKSALENVPKTNEGDFLSGIMEKVEQNVDPNANPMEAVSGLMSSGVLTDLMSGLGNGLGNGSLDLSKLMGAVQGLISSVGQMDGADPNMTNMISGMMQQVTNMSSSIVEEGEIKEENEDETKDE